MKSPFENRFFCSMISLLSAWCIFTDFKNHHGINIVNFLFFFCSTYLALHKKKKPESNHSECTKKTDFSEYSNQHDLILNTLFKRK